MKQKVMATVIINRAIGTRYSDVIANMRREYSCWLNTCYTTVEQAHNILNKHEALYKIKQRKSRSRYRGRFNNNNDNDAQYSLQYRQDNNGVARINGKINLKIKCFEYNKNEHYADQCPTRNQDNSKGEQHAQDTTTNDDSTLISENNNIEGGEEHIQTMEVLHDEDSVIIYDNNNFEESDVNFMSYQEEISHNINNKDHNYLSSDILLDSGSSCSVFNNNQLLENIKDSDTTLRYYTNGEHQNSHKKGYFAGFFYVWYNTMSMLNILSFAEVRKKFRITMDTNKETSMNVHLENNKIMKFKEVSSGLYLYKDKWKVINKNLIHKQSYLSTVLENKVKFSKKQVIMADEARDLYIKLGMPGYDIFIKTITNNDIRNSKVTVDYAKRVVYMYGREIASLKGKDTRRKPERINNAKRVELPRSIIEFHLTTFLAADYMIIQHISFLYSISNNIKLRTAESINGKNPYKKDILNAINRVLNIYQTRGFQVKQINGDNEFMCVTDDILPMRMNIVAAEECVGEVERSIRTIKDETRCRVHRLLFNVYPRQMVKGCVGMVLK